MEIEASDKGHCCGGCRFFRHKGASPVGECRKNPVIGHMAMAAQQNPITGQTDIITKTFGYFPSVDTSGWCGAWQLGEVDEQSQAAAAASA